jgi:Mor family transcriptional regulator
MSEDTIKKINHYELMLKDFNLSERHIYWIVKELRQLKEKERERGRDK